MSTFSILVYVNWYDANNKKFRIPFSCFGLEKLKEEEGEEEEQWEYFYLQRTAMTNVIAGSMLLIAHEKVGEVNFNPA